MRADKPDSVGHAGCGEATVFHAPLWQSQSYPRQLLLCCGELLTRPQEILLKGLRTFSHSLLRPLNVFLLVTSLSLRIDISLDELNTM